MAAQAETGAGAGEPDEKHDSYGNEAADSYVLCH